MIRKLLERRLPQILGVYLLGAWGFVQFVDWAVKQYVLSPHLTNFVVVLLLLLLPSVWLLAYRYGAPGDNRWTRTEAVGIPLNLIVAAAVLYAGFAGKDLGAATTTVVVENDQGNAVERSVPKREFRKNVALFYFDNRTGEPKSDWLSPGLTLALQTDLSQEMFITASSPMDVDGTESGGIMQELQQAGFTEGVDVPLSLKREIARKRHLGAFLSGVVERDSTGLSIATRLYETRRAKLLAEHSYSGGNVFELVDRISEQLRRDLDLPAYRIEESPDLPVSELLTSSSLALEDAAVGLDVWTRGDLQAALPKLVSAVARDPTFAMAQFELSFLYWLSNRRIEAESAMRAGLKHLYRLPERVRLEIRAVNQAVFEEDAVKALNTARYWAELYPGDIAAHRQLVQIYTNGAAWDQAISELETILGLDPTRYDNLRQLGDIYREKGEFDHALESYQRYADQFPRDYRSFTSISVVYRAMGRLEEAREAAKRALVIQPDEVDVLVVLARIEMNLGDFESAVLHRDQALAASKGPRDQVAVFGFDESLHYLRGQFARLEQDYRRRSVAAAEFMDPVSRVLALVRSEALLFAPEAGRKTFALRALDSLSATVPPPFDALVAPTYVSIYVGLGDARSARREVERLSAIIEDLGFQALGVEVSRGRGGIAEIEGDCRRAIDRYREVQGLRPGGWRAVLAARGIGRCQRALGELDAAERTLSDLLKRRPSDPATHLDLALVYQDLGRQANAVDQLEAALKVWENADPGYKPAQAARDKLAELTESAS